MLRNFFTGAASLALLFGAFTQADAANTPPKIGLVQIDLSNPFHLGEVDGAKEAARRAGFQLIVTSGEGDVNKQIQAVENLINQSVDAISINFIDAGAIDAQLVDPVNGNLQLKSGSAYASLGTAIANITPSGTATVPSPREKKKRVPAGICSPPASIIWTASWVNAYWTWISRTPCSRARSARSSMG